jgi:hypothetical protein
MQINDERPNCRQRTSTHSRIFRSNVRAACQAAVVGRHFPLPQPSRFARIGMPSQRLTLPSAGAGARCARCHGSAVPLRNLSSPLSPSSFAVMPSSRFIPSIDAASPLPQLRPFCCPQQTARWAICRHIRQLGETRSWQCSPGKRAQTASK